LFYWQTTDLHLFTYGFKNDLLNIVSSCWLVTTAGNGIAQQYHCVYFSTTPGQVITRGDSAIGDFPFVSGNDKKSLHVLEKILTLSFSESC